MSYILAALKKAERERRPKRALDMEELGAAHWEQPPPTVERFSRSRVALILTLILALGLVLLFWRLQRIESQFADLSQSPAPVAAEVEEVEEVEKGVLSASVPPAQVQSPPAAVLSARLPEELALEGVLYFEGQPERARAFIDGQRYSSGEEIAPGVRILTVEQYAVTLTNGLTSRTYSIR